VAGETRSGSDELPEERKRIGEGEELNDQSRKRNQQRRMKLQAGPGIEGVAKLG